MSLAHINQRGRDDRSTEFFAVSEIDRSLHPSSYRPEVTREAVVERATTIITRRLVNFEQPGRITESRGGINRVRRDEIECVGSENQ